MRHSKPEANEPVVIIDRAALNDLHEFALKSTVRINPLTYREVQQVLTLDALLKHFSSMGLQAPFKLELPK